MSSLRIDGDDAPQVIVSLEDEYYLIARLDHLKWIRVEHEARHAHRQAFGLWVVLREVFDALVVGLEGPGKEGDVHMLVGAFHSFPFGLGDVAVEAGIPGSVSTKV